jgi:hypothetical protein
VEEQRSLRRIHQVHGPSNSEKAADALAQLSSCSWAGLPSRSFSVGGGQTVSVFWTLSRLFILSHSEYSDTSPFIYDEKLNFGTISKYICFVLHQLHPFSEHYIKFAPIYGSERPLMPLTAPYQSKRRHPQHHADAGWVETETSGQEHPRASTIQYLLSVMVIIHNPASFSGVVLIVLRR